MGMRDKVTHKYLEVKLNGLWETIQQALRKIEDLQEDDS
jgi:uncharacterized protein with HEPN domain